MARVLAILLVVGLVLTIAWVATTKGFPSTHRAVTAFFHDDLGLSWGATTQATNFVRKAFHIPAYALVALLTWFALPRAVRRPWIVICVVLLIALADEWIQFRNPARGGSLRDVLIDLVGASLGILLATRWQKRRAERDPKTRSDD